MGPSARRTDWGSIRWTRVGAAALVVLVGLALAVALNNPFGAALWIAAALFSERILRSSPGTEAN